MTLLGEVWWPWNFFSHCSYLLYKFSESFFEISENDEEEDNSLELTLEKSQILKFELSRKK